MAKSRGRPLDKDKLDRAELLELACREFCDRGFDGVSIRKLAAQIGVSDSLFVHHFGSKQKLWHEAVDTLIDREFRQLIELLQRSHYNVDPLQWLRLNFAGFLQLARSRPAMFRLLFNELDTGGERAAYLKSRYLVPYVKLFDQAIDLCRERHLIKSVTNHSIHTLLLGAVKILINPGFLQLGRPEGEPVSDRNGVQVDDLVEMIFYGVVTTTS